MSFFFDMEKETLANNCFRKVVYTGEHMQLVLMSLEEEQEIPLEIHPKIDQLFRVEEGHIEVHIYDSKGNDVENVDHVMTGQSVIIPAGTYHKIISKDTTKLYTIYSPPQHPPGTVECVKKLINKIFPSKKAKK